MPNRNFYPDPTYEYPKNVILDTAKLTSLDEAPDPLEYKLYNIGGQLYWNGELVETVTGDLWQEEGGTGPNIYYEAGDVAIGKSTASYPLDVSGIVKTDDDVIIANTKELQFQDSLGGVTAHVSREADDDLAVTNETAAKNINLITSSGAVVVTGDVQISGSLKLQESGGTDLATITSAALGAARAYTIPDAGGSASFILSTSTPAQGDVLYFDGTTWVSIVAGTDGYFLRTQGAGANPKWDYPVRGNLTETSSDVLTISGGTSAIWGGGTTIQVVRATVATGGYLANSDFTTFSSKYDGLPSQAGNTDRYLRSGGSDDSEYWATIVSSAVAGYTAVGFFDETSFTVTHNFGAYPIVQVIDTDGVEMIPNSVTHTNTNEFVVTFTDATSGSIIASVGSPYIWNIVGKSVDYTLQSSDTVVLGNDEITLTLPSAVGVEGKVYTIKNITSDVYVTAKGDGVELIDTDNEFSIPAQAAIDVVSDGAQWWVV